MTHADRVPIRTLAVLGAVLGMLAISGALAAEYERLPADRFVLVEASGDRTPFLSAIGGRRLLGDDAPGLPTGPLLAYQLSGQLEWLRSYDVDGSGRLDPSEYTHAWMLKAVEEVTGRRYPVDALAVHPSTAQLSRGSRRAAAPAPVPAPRPATGTMLTETDERLVRNVLDDPRATGARTANALVDAAQAIQDWYAPAGGEGGDSGSGGGSRGGGSSGGSW